MRVLARCRDCGDFTHTFIDDPRTATIGQALDPNVRRPVTAEQLDIVLRAIELTTRCARHQPIAQNDLNLFMEEWTGVVQTGFTSLAGDELRPLLPAWLNDTLP